MSTYRGSLRVSAKHLLCLKKFVNDCVNKQLFNVIRRNFESAFYIFEGDIDASRFDMGKQKRKNFENNNGPVIPTEIHLTVIGTGGPGSTRALLLSTQYARYLFNCGEGTSRFGSISSAQLRGKAFVNLRNLDNVFITHKSWDNCGGLLSLALTLGNQAKAMKEDYQDKLSKEEARAKANKEAELNRLKKKEKRARLREEEEKARLKEEEGYEQSRSIQQKEMRADAIKEDSVETKSLKEDDADAISGEEDVKAEVPEKTLNIYGPDGVEDIPSVSRKFDEKENMKIEKCSGKFSDNIFTITPVIFHEEDDALEPDTKKQRMDSEDTTKNRNQDVAYAYICEATPLMPKILIEKVSEAGITVGPDVGKLKRGLSVTLPNGKVVTPEMVTEAVSLNERPFLIVECPTESFLPQLVASPELKVFMNPDLKDSLSLIVHMTPAEVFNSCDYQAWMKRFSCGTSHLVMNRECGESELLHAKAHNLRLNFVDREVFPLLPDPEGEVSSAQQNGSCSATKSQDDASQQGRVVKALCGSFYSYRTTGEKGFNVGKDDFDKESVLEPYKEDQRVIEETAKLQSLFKKNTNDASKAPSHSYPKVVFLGTGSAEGQKMRAQSCILVQLSKHNVVLLDCGEDAYGQLFRFYGRRKALQILRKLKAIYVSHLHADHHQGLITLLKEREWAFAERNLPLKPAIVMAPIQIRRWLGFYEMEVEQISHLCRLNHHQQDYAVTDSLKSFELVTNQTLKKELQLKEYQTVKVYHTSSSFGVTFTARNGFKLTYSGDTRPCQSLINAGRHSDLLIHEATHEDDLLDLAKASKHSTFSEAMNVGAKMAAKHVILTHFSQRYAYTIPMDNLDLPPNVGIAYDNMQVCPRTFHRLPKLIPALSAIFNDELEKLRAKDSRRNFYKRQEIPNSLEKLAQR